jgi:hypothetical protein
MQHWLSAAAAVLQVWMDMELFVVYFDASEI